MKKNNRGFTLVELMIVIAIIGVLAAVGYPAYINAVNKGNRADGIDSLLSLAGRMEEFYMNNDTYVGATINAAGTGTVGSDKTSDGLYTLSITAATAYAYTLTATPVVTDTECGNLILESTGEKRDSAGSGYCW
jgi:type IV pilus assembly protein PilE